MTEVGTDSAIFEERRAHTGDAQCDNGHSYQLDQEVPMRHTSGLVILEVGRGGKTHPKHGKH